MSISAITDRIASIQSAIQELSTPAATSTTATTAGTATTAATGAAEFDTVLNTLSGAPTGGGVTGEDIVAQAKNYLGVPYVFGGEDETGMDCSGLVQRVLADLGIDAPRVVQDQADIGVEVPSLDQARPGDLIVTKGEGHIVIYAGDGKIIHAPRPGKDVQLVDNYLSPDEISTIRRVATAAEPAVAAAPASTITQAEMLTAMQSVFATQQTGLSSALGLLTGASS
ncbi:C40 family peptidase [Microbacterium sp. NPDC003461]